MKQNAKHQYMIRLLLSTSFLVHPSVGNLFFTWTNTEETNYDVTHGNPHRGLMASPAFYNYDETVDNIDSALDFYYIGLNEVLIADPLLVGSENAFDWEPLETLLTSSASKSRHAIATFAIHYPGRELYMPQYVLDRNISLYPYDTDWLGAGVTPDYGEAEVMLAIEQFIEELGRQYDGDPRVSVFHLGLLGFWGEWHTYPLDSLIPVSSMERTISAFNKAFTTTKLQGRYPFEPAYQAKFGLFDASFAYNTLDGPANGNQEVDWYFWPFVSRQNHTDFWKYAPMGGETRPEIQPIVFNSTYPAGTFQHQDFNLCVQETHASFIFHQDAWVTPGYSGERLKNAMYAHARMGYSFIVESVAASKSQDPSEVILVALVQQVGVAPFYYPLDLVLDCDSLSEPLRLGGVESLVEYGSLSSFAFNNVPSDSSCLGSIKLSLASRHVYAERPIRFAQGDGSVSFSLPVTNATTPLLPEPSTAGPTKSPTRGPTGNPTPAPLSSSPTDAPVSLAPTPGSSVGGTSVSWSTSPTTPSPTLLPTDTVPTVTLSKPKENLTQIPPRFLPTPVPPSQTIPTHFIETGLPTDVPSFLPANVPQTGSLTFRLHHLRSPARFFPLRNGENITMDCAGMTVEVVPSFGGIHHMAMSHGTLQNETVVNMTTRIEYSAPFFLASDGNNSIVADSFLSTPGSKLISAVAHNKDGTVLASKIMKFNLHASFREPMVNMGKDLNITLLRLSSLDARAELSNGMNVAIDTQGLTLIADVPDAPDDIAYMKFSHESAVAGQHNKTKTSVRFEYSSPYSLGGDRNGTFFAESYLNFTGPKTVTVTAYSLCGILASKSVAFNVVNDLSLPTLTQGAHTTASNLFVPSPIAVPVLSVPNTAESKPLDLEDVHSFNTNRSPSLLFMLEVLRRQNVNESSPLP